MRQVIKADITLRGVQIVVDTDKLEDEAAAQRYVNQQGFGSNDFDLNLADEEIEVFDAYPEDA